MRLWRWLATLGLACVGLAGCGEAEDERAEQTRETRRIMGEIFGGLQVALPASADLERFRAPESQAEIAASLDMLARNAELLEEHAARWDEQVHFLARSAARDARELQRTYAEGRSARAAFLLRQIVENCVVCHTRLPSHRDAPLTEGFVDTGALEALPLEPRATLQIATRRFDEALDTLEELFASSEHPALMFGPLTDYLVVSIRVKGDYTRPVPVLARFAEREDLWESLRMDVAGWVEALPRLAQQTRGKPSLAGARTLMDQADSLTVLPENRTGLVYLVAASAILEHLIDTGPANDRDLAEAYFLLGIVEARIGRNYWVSPAPFLLERSIRLAPQEPFAREAYALLEHEVLQTYEGSDHEALPADDAQRLAELRALLPGG